MALKHMEHQKQGDSLLDKDDDDEEEDSEGESKDLAALQSTLDVLRGFDDGVRPSSADCSASVVTRESFIQKWASSSPSRGPSPKHPYVTTDGI